ncbi:MAG: DUF4406 domain-containing protein [Treponemataceae bacterium]
MKLYISGGISNSPNYKENFAQANKELTKAGYSVVDHIYLRNKFHR